MSTLNNNPAVDVQQQPFSIYSIKPLLPAYRRGREQSGECTTEHRTSGSLRVNIGAESERYTYVRQRYFQIQLLETGTTMLFLHLPDLLNCPKYYFTVFKISVNQRR
ncbi:MAG: hypothetical protein K8S14_06325 [Actinomycetia bacterium]|nr:hypothetical protein [Actinomycetes bacterium]